MDIKKCLESVEKLGLYETIGELLGASFVDAEVAKFPGSKEKFEALKQFVDAQGLDGSSTIKEVLKNTKW